MKFFNSIRKAEINKSFYATLYHDFGNTVELDGIDNSTLEFIKRNLGRDKILTTDQTCINLSKFNLLNYSETKKVSNPSTKIGRVNEQ
jgi:hypothetical protein